MKGFALAITRFETEAKCNPEIWSTLAFRLATHLRRPTSTCDDLRGLALSLVELKFGLK